MTRRLAAVCGSAFAAFVVPSLVFAQQPATTTPPPKAPVFNRANERLPAWLRVRGEFRERLEGFDGLGFNGDREDLYWLTRVRFNTTVTASTFLSFQAQVQDARVARKTVGPTAAPFKAPFDLRTAFADVGTPASRVAARVGRQELVYGEQRLVGHVGWLNAARTFDAAKVTFRTKGFSVDAFGASVVRTLVDEFDRSGAGNRFAGAYATTTKLIPQGTVEPYLFWKRDENIRGERGALSELQHSTIGLRLVGKMPSLDYGVEMAIQRGTLGSEDVRAWAGHWQLRESLPGPGLVTLTGEYNFA